MAKSKEKLTALGLRRKGQSVKEIAKSLGVSKGTVSVWTRDILLTKQQKKDCTSAWFLWDIVDE